MAVLYFAVILSVATITVITLLIKGSRQNQMHGYQATRSRAIELPSTESGGSITNTFPNRKTSSYTSRSSTKEKQHPIIRNEQTCSHCRRRINIEEEYNVSEYDGSVSTEPGQWTCQDHNLENRHSYNYRRPIIASDCFSTTCCQHGEITELNRVLQTSRRVCFLCGKGISDTQTICSICRRILSFLLIVLIILIIIRKI